jgi:peptide/nickel transport system permease protein
VLVARTIQSVAKMMLECLAAILGVVMVSGLPSLFDNISINVKEYVETLGYIIMKLIHPLSIEYGMNRKVFPQILIHYRESLLLCGLAIVAALVLAWGITHITLLFFRRHMERIQMILAFFESLPDLLIIVTFQFIVIAIFKKTGWLIFQLASIGEERSLFLPVICLSIPISLLFAKLLLQQYENELRKPYVEYAFSKGLSFFYILNKHVLRNVALGLLYYSKTMIWFMLSNLIMIEYVFNVSGITAFLLEYHTPEVFALGVLLLYIPVFLFYKIFYLFLPQLWKGEK